MNDHPVLNSITKVGELQGLIRPTVFSVDPETPDESPPPPVNHYARTFRGLELDVYRICKLYDITDPAIQHAVKKLLRFGSGEHKSRGTDIAEAIQSLQRWQAMEAEDADS